MLYRSLLTLILVFFLLPAWAAKPDSPLHIAMDVRAIEDGTALVSTTLTTAAPIKNGRLSIQPTQAVFVDGADLWHGELKPGEQAQVIGRYRIEDTDLAAWRAIAQGDVGGWVVTRIAEQRWPNATLLGVVPQTKAAAPVRAGAEEYPSR